MPTPYPIIEINPDDAEKPEYLGSKAKFWLSRPRPGVPAEEDRWLFKAVRRRPDGSTPDGDDWAEKVAAEIARLLRLPHAEYEMAVARDELGPLPGVISKSVGNPGRARLVEGNELLVRYASVPGYPVSRDTRYSRVTSYTPALVVRKLTELGVSVPADVALPDGVETGADLFVGYLALDALIGNTDRHDQNWAVFEEVNTDDLVLAPTYDHASCLGRELSDAKRKNRLRSTTPPHDLRTYRHKPTSRFHDADGARMSPLAAFEAAAHVLPIAASAWIERILSLHSDDVDEQIARVPAHRITPLGMEFAARVIADNRDALVSISHTLP